MAPEPLEGPRRESGGFRESPGRAATREFAMSTPQDQAFDRFARTGDPAALAEVYDLVAPELLRVALHLTRDAAAAEDALQATFLAAIRGVRGFRRGRAVMPWLAGILANQVHAERRKQRGGAEEGLAELEAAPAGPEQEAALAELVEHLRASLDRIPESFRSVLVLRLEHQLTATEIAHALGRPPGTVRSQLARGTELLRRTLPAGLAVAALAFLSPPVRGLAAVREAVLAEAGLAVGAGVGVSLVAGGLLVKKLIVAASVAIVLAGAWWLAMDTRPAGPGRVQPASPLAAELRAPEPEPARVEPAAREELALAEPASAPAPPPEVPPATTGAVEIVARFADGSAAAGTLAILQVAGAGVFRRPTRQAFTDDTGRARLEGIPPGHHPVRLLLGGHGQVRVEAGETSRTELELFAGYTAEIEVVDETEHPLAGAEVWLSERSMPAIGHVVGRTDASGRFRLEHLSDYHYIGARAAGRAPSFVRNLRGVEGAVYPVRIRLDEPGTRAQGVVLGADGRGVPDAIVSFHREDAHSHVVIENGLTMPAPPPARAVTSDDGSFRVASAAVGAMLMRVQAEGHAPYAAPVTLVEGASNPVTVRLEPEARVVGTVRDAGGEPVSGVRVHTRDRTGEAGSTTYSMLDGTFVLQGLAAGAVELEAIHAERGLARIELQLSAGQDTSWDPRLSDEVRIAGVVQGPDGAPVAHWPVTVMDDVVGRVGAHTTTTDASGRFAVTGLEERPYTLWIHEPGSWRGFPRHVEAGVWPAPQELVVRLVPESTERGSLAAEVLAPGGGAARGVTATLWHQEEKMWRSFPVDPDSGLLTVPGVPPGTVQVELRPDDHPWVRLGEHSIEAGRVTDLGRIQLEEGGRIEGALAGGSEESLETLAFLLTRPDRGAAGMVIRSGREFRSSSLAPGRYRLGVRGDGVVSQSLDLEVTAGKTLGVDVTLAPAWTLDVVIQPLAALELPPRHIWASIADGEGSQVWIDPAIALDADGLYRTRVSAPAGTYELIARSQGGLEGKREITLEPGAPPAPVSLQLVRPR